MAVSLPVIPKDIPKWMYEAFRRQQIKSAEQSSGLAAIGRGEAPDGSGNPLVPTGHFFLLPGLSGGQIGYGDTRVSGTLTLGSTASTTKGFLYLGYPTIRVALDEAAGLLGVNTSTPTAALHVRPGTSGTTTLIPSSDIDTQWDGPRDAAQALAGGSLWSAVATNDGSTLWAGYSTTPVGATPQQFGLDGSVTTNKVWTVNMYCSILSGTAVSGTLSFRLRDSAGKAYLYTASGTTSPGGLAGVSTFPTFSLITFTIDGTGTPAGTGETANSIEVGVAFDNPSGGYCAVTYIEVTTGGDSNIARWDNSSATQLGKVDSAGRFGIGTGSTTLSAMLSLLPDAAGTLGQLIKGAASQSARLLKLTDDSDVELGGFTHLGELFLISGAGTGKVLKSSAAGVGSWGAASALPYVAKTGTYQILVTDSIINCTSGTFTVTLPTAVGIAGQIFYIKNSGTGSVTVDTLSAQTIDAETTQTVSPSSAMQVASDGANWIIL